MATLDIASSSLPGCPATVEKLRLENMTNMPRSEVYAAWEVILRKHQDSPLSQALRTTLSITVCSAFPVIIFWGKDLRVIYNQVYRDVLGMKHPYSAGEPASKVFFEIWGEIGGMLKSVLYDEKQFFYNDKMFDLTRTDKLPDHEECFFTFSYSPILNETGRPGGVFCSVTETTQRVLTERRLALLRELMIRTNKTTTLSSCSDKIAQLFREPDYNRDIPWVYIYEIDYKLKEARLLLWAQNGLQNPTEPLTRNKLPLERVDLREGYGQDELTRAISKVINEVIETRTRVYLRRNSDFPDLVTSIAMPIFSSKMGPLRPDYYIVCGRNVHTPMTESYSSFYDLVASHISTSFANAIAFEMEKARADALEELNRAKTTFFSNVSHEFRTPLSLIISPIEELLASDSSLIPTQRFQAEMALRNAHRLMRLATSLLQFTAVEESRLRTSFCPTHLGQLTRQLASSFENMARKNDIDYTVDCPIEDSSVDGVYIDPYHWEKIVFNLLSNAFKYTWSGKVRVSVYEYSGEQINPEWMDGEAYSTGVLSKEDGWDPKIVFANGSVMMEVMNTGSGVDKHDLQKIFERFYRPKVSYSRSHEGIGIGLSLVKELVLLHGGSIEIKSKLGCGTSVYVRIPRGSSHLPEDCIIERSAAQHESSLSFAIDEMERWTETPKAPFSSMLNGEDTISVAESQDVEIEDASPRSGEKRSLVLLADDNADMRTFLVNMLSPHFDVIAVKDGAECLRRLAVTRPDLILSDVMMPVMNGFELTRKVRSSPTTRNIPVILLTAQARENVADAECDDYMVKPFSSVELVNRVKVHINLGKTRQQASKTLLEVERLQAENSANKHLLSLVSHELRTPLNCIIGTLGLVQQHDLSDDIKEQFTTMNYAATMLMSIISDLLDVAKLDAGHFNFDHTTFSPQKFFNCTTEMLVDRASERRLKFVCHIDVNVPRLCHSDEGRMRQVLLNLVNNAIKFTSAGSVSVSMKAVEHANRKHVLRFEVEDSGIGIPKEKLDTIFQPFTQVDQTTTRKYDGVGLGLAICKQLVTKAGGAIGVTSTLGEGSRFWFEWPITIPCERQMKPLPVSIPSNELILRAAASQAVSPLPLTNPSVYRKDSWSASPSAIRNPGERPAKRPKFENCLGKVLVAEDNPLNQRILEMQLTQLGYESYLVDNGKEVIDRLKEEGFAVYNAILMDCNMPILDGFEATKQIRLLELERQAQGISHPAMPIIAVTANAYLEDRERCLAAGMTDFIAKPITKEQLSTMLQKLIIRDASCAK